MESDDFKITEWKDLEMERDCAITHGTSKMLLERLFECSDYYRVDVCEKCGNFASSNEECRYCKDDTLVSVRMPYVNKLVLQELNAMGIKTQIVPGK